MSITQILQEIDEIQARLDAHDGDEEKLRSRLLSLRMQEYHYEEYLAGIL